MDTMSPGNLVPGFFLTKDIFLVLKNLGMKFSRDIFMNGKFNFKDILRIPEHLEVG